MESKKILTRDNKLTDELQRTVEKKFKGFQLIYKEVYYLDYDVNEDTGIIDKKNKVEFYTKSQISRNMRTLKSSYLIAKGAAAPSEIISFREKYHIAASTLSIILGFSKNTISNIENDGVTSLTSGRLIKMSINNKEIISYYIRVCDSIDARKKEELSKKILEFGI
ncbi:transcriptional regulator [Tenacibaculum finnmarkense genomovar ulcerans]|uniref:transcriptional regulator n=1 Tax=Tenacibaculum finnmarkense TaxID=2781243 RepID=UPI001EFAAE01|nr:transcriptional regulator [Tenacibaculum finnmarkense]MCG8236732.1 transcriptional regulator [Tenacibaculum finnmarkense genomovar ulcerans]